MGNLASKLGTVGEMKFYKVLILAEIKTVLGRGWTKQRS